jgi:hypothetical protein
VAVGGSVAARTNRVWAVCEIGGSGQCGECSVMDNRAVVDLVDARRRAGGFAEVHCAAVMGCQAWGRSRG